MRFKQAVLCSRLNNPSGQCFADPREQSPLGPTSPIEIDLQANLRMLHAVHRDRMIQIDETGPIATNPQDAESNCNKRQSGQRRDALLIFTAQQQPPPQGNDGRIRAIGVILVHELTLEWGGGMGDLSNA
jgi:hypothetical protein